VCEGIAGTGKTSWLMYNALSAILNRQCEQTQLVIVRSIVPSRDIGFLKGNQDEKEAVYELPYKAITQDFFPQIPNAYEALKGQGLIRFVSTSFLRGLTIKNAIVLVDEMQNLSGEELHTIITRIGDKSRIMFAGDYYQSDLKKRDGKDDVLDFLNILKSGVPNIYFMEYGLDDILRSPLVKAYLLIKHKLENKNV